MKKLSHYKDSNLFKFINVLSEIITLIIAYFLSGYIRVVIPISMAKRFWWREIWQYAPVGVIGAILIVLVYFAFGDYKTIHVLNPRMEILWMGIIQGAGTLVMSGLLFMLNGYQFSRFWLLIYAFISWLLILIKRFACSAIAIRLFAKYVSAYRILLVGSGPLAQRFNKKVRQLGEQHYHIIGYLSDYENEDFKVGYLGSYSSLRDVLMEETVNQAVDQIVIAEENLDAETLQEILSLCSVYGIAVYQMPVFGDYLPEARGPKNSDPFIQAFAGDIILFRISVMNTNNILGVKIAVTNMEKTIKDITKNLEAWRGKYICVSNVHTTVMAHDDSEYRKVQNEAVMALPDGSPLSSYSRQHGNSEAERVTGPDLMQEILKCSGEHGWRHFFYGSTPETLAKLKLTLTDKYPDANIVGMISPPFRDITPEEDQKYIDMINDEKPDFLWVGLGAPKQEIWMAAHKNRVNCLMIGVGAAFDYEAGNIKRAPYWMQKCSLEWLYRLLQDPKRLFKRYFITNIKYMWLTRR